MIKSTAQRARAIRPLFASHVRRYWPALVLGSGLAVLQVVTKLAEPWPLAWLVDNALSGTPPGSAAIRGDLVMAAASLSSLASLGSIGHYWSARLFSSAGVLIANDMRPRVFTPLQRLSLRYHKRRHVGDVT